MAIKSGFLHNHGILLAANPKLPLMIAIKDFLYLKAPQCHKPCNRHEMWQYEISALQPNVHSIECK